ncbi:cupin domain-containing protein [Roseateles cellulosilyticus]|uniref:Cupin domain-containing protein n=1 Tax=Pelomonas cellulosilytica TaxID=2906762 RepID=A0ABS8XJ26_9BURK|nr:cupin domain-containing protein [Pelomonas sp. P8]MCE4552866.1 cupin domain-containing protein [Pelomonas sp. P8]
MLNRPHTEFVQAQMLPWRRIPPGAARPDAEYKYLSRDPDTGACTCLIRYPAGWSRLADETLDAAEEFYVLEGELEINGLHFGADRYGQVPRGLLRHSMSTRRGAVVLTFFDARPELGPPVPQAGLPSIGQRDVLHMPWDMRLNDQKLAHLGISRKDLRTDQKTGERTFLSMMLPHSEPPGSQGPRESHPVVEECFVIAGSLVGPYGEMHAGAYFWRPPGIPHGPFGTRWGCVALIRFVGGRHVNIWTTDEAPFDFHQPYAPVLPPDLAHLRDVPYLPARGY